MDFLMNDPRLPRSLAYGLNSIRNNLRSLPRHDKPLRAVNRIRRELSATDVRGMSATAVSDYLDQCQVRLNQVHDEIHKTYFDFRPRRKRAGQKNRKS